MYTYTLGGTLYKRPLVLHALLARTIFMFSEHVFLFWDCLDFGVFLRIGSRRNPSWRNSCICQCRELGEVSFNSRLLGRHQSEDNTTTGLAHPHGSPGYRVSPLKNGPRQRLFWCTFCGLAERAMLTDQHVKGPAVAQPTDGEGASSDFQETEIKPVFLWFFIITRISELRGDQTHTLQGKV